MAHHPAGVLVGVAVLVPPQQRAGQRLRLQPARQVHAPHHRRLTQDRAQGKIHRPLRQQSYQSLSAKQSYCARFGQLIQGTLLTAVLLSCGLLWQQGQRLDLTGFGFGDAATFANRSTVTVGSVLTALPIPSPPVTFVCRR